MSYLELGLGTAGGGLVFLSPVAGFVGPPVLAGVEELLARRVAMAAVTVAVDV